MTMYITMFRSENHRHLRRYHRSIVARLNIIVARIGDIAASNPGSGVESVLVTMRPKLEELGDIFIDMRPILINLIRELTGLDTEPFRFEGKDAAGIDLSLEVLVNGCFDIEAKACAVDNLDCLTSVVFGFAGASDFEYAYNTALKERIIHEVNQMVDFDYTGRVEGFAFPVLFPTLPPNAEFPWDSISITARYLYEHIPFIYHRGIVSKAGIDRSRSNFQSTLPYGNASLNINGGGSCSFSGVNLLRGVGGDFTYSTLNHIGQIICPSDEIPCVSCINDNVICVASTGSAYFVSELIHFGGGLPYISESEAAFTCNATSLDTTQSWLVCCTSPNNLNLEATSSWRVHPRLIDYFREQFGATQPVFNTIDPTIIDTVLCGQPPNLPSSEGSGLNKYMQFGNGGVWRLGKEEEGSEWLYETFRMGQLAFLETGDYVLLNSGSLESIFHGLLIIGWGVAVETPEGLNAGQVDTQSFSHVRPRNINGIPLDSIPYVVDFAYGYGYESETNPCNGRVGWLQDVRPRPFYATNAFITINNLQNIKERLGGVGFPVDTDETFAANYAPRLRYGYQPFLTSNLLLANWTFFHLPNGQTNSAISVPFTKLYKLTFPC